MRDNENWELKKYELEVQKYNLAVKSLWLDMVAKIGVPVGLLVIAAATYFSNSTLTQEQFAFEKDVKQKEFLQKQQDIFIRQSNSERARRSEKAAFITRVMESSSFRNPDADQQIERLAHAHFLPSEVEEVLVDLRRIRIASPGFKTPSDKNFYGDVKQTDFKRLGLDQQQAGQYALALASFQVVTSLNPADAQGWMYRAYAEYRLGQGQAALHSVSSAIGLQPTEQRLKELLVINATKILCFNGRMEEGLNYIKQAITVMPQVQPIARGDTELNRQCNLGWPDH